MVFILFMILLALLGMPGSSAMFTKVPVTEFPVHNELYIVYIANCNLLRQVEQGSGDVQQNLVVLWNTIKTWEVIKHGLDSGLGFLH